MIAHCARARESRMWRASQSRRESGDHGRCVLGSAGGTVSARIGGMPVPRIVPALLSFTAGFVDSCTFLALFGLYVAQVTGSFVVFGVGFVAHEDGFVIKVLAIPMFFAAGVFATICSAVLHRGGRAPLPYVLALECALLAAFLLLGVTTPMHDANA